MARLRLYFSLLEDSSKSRIIECETKGQPWTRETVAGPTRENPVTVKVPNDVPCVITVTVADSRGPIRGSQTHYTYIPRSAPATVEAALPATAAPSVSQDGASVKVAVDLPPAIGDDGTLRSYTVSVRTADEGVTDPADSLAVPDVKALSDGKATVSVPMAPSGDVQEVFVRVQDDATGEVADWVQESVVISDPPDLVKGQDFEDDWGSTDIGTVYGLPSAEQVGSELRAAVAPSPFASPGTGGYPSSPFATLPDALSPFSIRGIFPLMTVTLPEVNAGALHDFVPQVWPQVDDHGRIAEPSPFSERINPFRPTEIMHLSPFQTRPDRSPIEMDVGIRVAKDGSETLRDEKPMEIGKPIRAWRYQAICRIKTWQGRAPRLRRIYFWRRIRNRKWEYLVDYDPSSVGDPFTFTIPAEVVTVLGMPVVTVTPQEALAHAGVSYSAHVFPVQGTPGAYTVDIKVTQRVRGEATAVSGAWSYTFPVAFGAAPKVAVAAIDSTNSSFAGFDSISDTAISAGYMRYPSVAGGADGDGTVHILAEGDPIPQGSGGTLKLAIHIKGA